MLKESCWEFFCRELLTGFYKSSGKRRPAQIIVFRYPDIVSLSLIYLFLVLLTCALITNLHRGIFPHFVLEIFIFCQKVSNVLTFHSSTIKCVLKHTQIM